MTNREAMRWVVKDPAPSSTSSANPWLAGNAGARRREFDPHEFVKTTGTLCHTREVAGSKPAAPIVKAPQAGALFACRSHPIGFLRARWKRDGSTLMPGALAIRLHEPGRRSRAAREGGLAAARQRLYGRSERSGRITLSLRNR